LLELAFAPVRIRSGEAGFNFGVRGLGVVGPDVLRFRSGTGPEISETLTVEVEAWSLDKRCKVGEDIEPFERVGYWKGGFQT
jgi:hypothetical protein